MPTERHDVKERWTIIGMFLAVDIFVRDGVVVEAYHPVGHLIGKNMEQVQTFAKLVDARLEKLP
jgi:hypothetical protein